MRRPNHFNVHELIQALQGTCTTINEHLPDGMTDDDLTEDDHMAIDNEIFLCDECGWWCEVCEMNDTGDHICNDCNDEFGDED